MAKRYTSIKIGNVIISLMLILIGIEQAKNGADPESRFFYIDNILVRVLGVLFIVFSIGLLFRKEFARKGIITMSLISILEVFATYDYSYPILETVSTFIIFTIILGTPLVFYLNRKVKGYFNIRKDELKGGYVSSGLIDESVSYKHSGVGIASFIIAIINIISGVAAAILIVNGILDTRPTGQLIAGTLFIFIIVSCLIGLFLGLAGLFSKKTKKVFSIWGTVLNGLFVVFFILVLITAISNYQQINDIINRNMI